MTFKKSMLQSSMHKNLCIHAKKVALLDLMAEKLIKNQPSNL